MGQALYRKHRPKKLTDVVGQEPITRALANALKQDKISHAYLFTGPRGVGKTSIARILAHEINSLPYDESATHLDIIEIDAASNRRIDEIRELRERVHNAPAAVKYKVYIIDEVHMLTREAFNALLKTLEEPPEHAVFILATTEAHKLPETIVSRTQRYTFRPIDKQKVIDHLRTIASQEKIDISDEALELIAEHGDGSFRDSISLLDQVRHSDNKVSLATVQRSLGIAPPAAVEAILTALATGDSQALLNELQAMIQHGYHAPQIAKQLGEKLRHELIGGQPRLQTRLISQLLRELIDVPAVHDPVKLLEISLLEACLQTAESTTPQPVNIPEPAKEASQAQTEPVTTVPAEKAEPAKGKTKTEASATEIGSAARTTDPEESSSEKEKQNQPEAKHSDNKSPKQKPPAKTKQTSSSGLDEQSWQEVLQAIKARHNTLYSVARMAIPRFDRGGLILVFSFPFHQKRLNDPKNKQVISDIILQQTGQTVTITCEVDVNVRSVPAAIAQPASSDPDLENISNIFGGGEVLE